MTREDAYQIAHEMRDNFDGDVNLRVLAYLELLHP
jgi:hypothetical protein